MDPLTSTDYPAPEPATTTPTSNYSHFSPTISEPIKNNWANSDSSPESISFPNESFGEKNQPVDKDDKDDKDSVCCSMCKDLCSIPIQDYFPFDIKEKPIIYISEAVNSSDNSSSFTSYIIKTKLPSKSYESKHRYSEFESLQLLLTRLHPTAIVPPIPEKHSLSDSLLKTSKSSTSSKEALIIKKRIRMLGNFLNRVASDSVLQREHVFHNFIGFSDQGSGFSSWNEILSMSGYHHLLKKKSTDSILFSTIERNTLRNSDPHFLASEDFTFRFLHQVSSAHKIQKKWEKQIGEISSVLSDLGEQYNAWSLTEVDDLAPVIEKIGESLDLSYTNTCNFANKMQEQVTEVLQEYVALAKNVEKLLKYRHKKHLEWEGLVESLEGKKTQLSKLEVNEHESQRIAAVLTAAEGTRTNETLSRASSGGLIATINSFIDNDPATTRRNQISKTKDRILLLQEQSERSLVELNQTNKQVQQSLDEFQKKKMYDFKRIFLGYANCYKEYHEAALKAWREA